ncbi:hypothetical protein SPW_7340 [Streptomyces sp. W007]|uniref:hypothetical protein n=1 Tax=Streptomyces sp. W007 TaxID=1055352 RepID=UPI000241A77B|nr:hypothetical protein [Streptomyces sp. W007]EHM24246.1 hypothetical protein SPW_7340 [Streptomyces sp. W007]
MGERCGTEPTVEELEAEYERARNERIETLYQGWGARDMAERIVDLEDELGADVDGMCTGMHADVAEAHCEIERLNAEVAQLRSAWKVSTATRESYRRVTRDLNGVVRELLSACAERLHERDRYRLAWLSARRRAAEEANLGAEAVEHLAADRDRWQRGHERAEAQLHAGRRANAELHLELERLRAKLRDVREYAEGRCSDEWMNEASASWVLHLLGGDLRESTRGPSMESVGEVDGETVWRLKPIEEI